MADVVQYIGARYVPLFASPLEWNINTVYEPLTIVIHQGNSYTSRQSVPAGIDITNEDFWALTSNYNAQIEAYRKEVAAFDARISVNTENIEKNTTDIAVNESDIDELNKKGSVVAIIGDSFTDPDFDPQTWVDYLSTPYTIKNYAVRGSGFLTTPGRGRFLDQLDKIKADYPTPGVVKKIIVYGGYNDYNKYLQGTNTINDISAAMFEFIAAVKSYGNTPLELCYCNVGNTASTSSYNRFPRFIKSLKINALQVNAPFHECWKWLMPGNASNFKDDNLHPNRTGQHVIAQHMNAIINDVGNTPNYYSIRSYDNASADVSVAGCKMVLTYQELYFSNGSLHGRLAATVNPSAATRYNFTLQTQNPMCYMGTQTRYAVACDGNIFGSGFYDISTGTLSIFFAEAATVDQNLNFFIVPLE